MVIKRQYVVNENNQRTAVLLDIKTFSKIEEILENHAFYHLIQNEEDGEILSLDDAKSYYATLDKN
jgi:hypothetical protein